MVPPVLRRLASWLATPVVPGALLGLVAAASAHAAPADFPDCTAPPLEELLSPAERAELEAAARAVPYAESVLWEATRDDARMLLVGTMHLPHWRHAAMEGAVSPALAGADLLLVEVTAEGEADMSRALVEDPGASFLSSGPTLPERLAPEEWEAVAAAARDRGIPPFVIARYKPTMAAMTLSMPVCLIGSLQDGTQGSLDVLLRDAAEAQGVPVEALEHWDTLFRLGDTIPEADQLAALVEGIADPERAEAATVATIGAYFDGRLDLMMAITEGAGDPGAEGGAEAGADPMAPILDDRNAAWIPVIEAAAARAPRLVVAAGAAHLPGEGGVLARLAARGWAVAPLDPATCCEGVWEAP